MASANIRQSPGGGEFATIKLFIDAAATVAGNIGTCVGTWTIADTSAVTWNKAVIIVADSAARAIGRPFQSGDTVYRHQVASGHAFICSADVDISDINIESQSSVLSDELFRADSGDNIDGTFRDCMLGFVADVDEQDIWYAANEAQLLNFTNVFFYNVGRSVIDWIGGPSSAQARTVNFNACSCMNIAFHSGRFGGAIVGCTGDPDLTLICNAHNCMFETTVGSGPIFSLQNTDTIGTARIENTISSEVVGNVTDNFGTEVLTNNGYSYVWTANTSPGAGDFVIVADHVETGGWDHRLVDDADNDAIAFHSTRTAAGSGLEITALDIERQSRDISTPSFDVGPFAITLEAAPGGIEILRRRIEAHA